MITAEEISEFKKTHHSLEKRMEEIGKNQCYTIMKLSEWLEELINNIESVREKGKAMQNSAVSTKIKIAKKGIRISKEVKYFENRVAVEFEKNNISEDVGKRFISIIKSIKDNDMPLAKKEFSYFEEISESNKEYEISKEEMKEKDLILKREQLEVKELLKEISELEKETVDLKKSGRYENLLKNLEKLEKIREAYLHSLLSKPVTELLNDVENHSMEDIFPVFPGKEKMTELQEFFSEYPEFGKCDIGKLCEVSEYNEKKLSHFCSEPSKFKKMVLGNKKLFETINALEQTTFLAVDDENKKVMNFYAEKIEGAQEIVEQIRLLSKEKNSCKEEYQKNKRIENRRKELSKYSKKELEKKLKDIEVLLELLHSNPEDAAENTAEHVKEQGMFSKIMSFFKGGS